MFLTRLPLGCPGSSSLGHYNVLHRMLGKRFIGHYKALHRIPGKRFLVRAGTTVRSVSTGQRIAWLYDRTIRHYYCSGGVPMEQRRCA
eukprot:394865-Rhodomonas_salina.3